MTTPTATRDDFLLAHWGKAAWIAEGHELHVPADDLARIVEMCKERALRLSDSPQWIPVGVRLPEMDINVLVVTPSQMMWTACLHGDEWYPPGDDMSIEVEPTHWMPLPEAP